MKKFVILFIFLLVPITGAAESLDGVIGEQLEQMDIAELENSWQTFLPEGAPLKEMLARLAKGEAMVDGEELLQALARAFLSAFSQSLWRMAQLMAPVILCGVMERMSSAFSSASLGQALHTGGYLLVTALMATDLGNHLSLCRENVSRMAEVMQALFPILLTLLAAVGSTASAAFFQPATVAASGMMTTLVHRFTLPLALGSAVTGMLDHLSPAIRLTRLSNLLKTLVNWTLGVGFTVFLSVTALQSMGAAAADGVSIRTAKYVADHFVPVVGGMFADTMDTLVGASLLIKNAVGITGLILLLAACAAPMLETLAAMGIYRCCAALLEPVSGSRICSCIHFFSNVLMMLFTIELSVAAMFLLLVAQMLAVGQMTVMLR